MYSHMNVKLTVAYYHWWHKCQAVDVRCKPTLHATDRYMMKMHHILQHASLILSHSGGMKKCKHTNSSFIVTTCCVYPNKSHGIFPYSLSQKWAALQLRMK